jgi:hypothetical protein
MSNARHSNMGSKSLRKASECCQHQSKRCGTFYLTKLKIFNFQAEIRSKVLKLGGVFKQSIEKDSFIVIVDVHSSNDPLLKAGFI